MKSRKCWCPATTHRSPAGAGTALKTTAQRRPELLRNEVLTESEREFLSRELRKEIVNG